VLSEPVASGQGWKRGQKKLKKTKTWKQSHRSTLAEGQNFPIFCQILRLRKTSGLTLKKYLTGELSFASLKKRKKIKLHTLM
jgi:hypothetical protein